MSDHTISDGQNTLIVDAEAFAILHEMASEANTQSVPLSEFLASLWIRKITVENDLGMISDAEHRKQEEQGAMITANNRQQEEHIRKTNERHENLIHSLLNPGHGTDKRTETFIISSVEQTPPEPFILEINKGEE